MQTEAGERSGPPPEGRGGVLAGRRTEVVFACAVLLATVISTPPNDDAMQAFASAFQADSLSKPFPVNVYESWHLRGFVHRCLTYALYRASALVVDPSRPLAFQYATATLYYGLLLLLIAAWCRLARGALARIPLAPLEAFGLCALALLTTSQWIHLQAEELAVVLTLGMAAAAVSESRAANFLAGIFPTLLFGCKYVTVVYALVPLTLLVFLGPEYRKNVRRVLLGSLAFGAAGAAFWLFAIPRELVDARDGRLLQSSALGARALAAAFLRGSLRAVQHLPFVITGLVSAVVALWLSRPRSGRTAALLLVIFAICSAPMLLQTKWFGYHYTGLLLFALVAVGLTASRLAPAWRGRWFGGVVGLTLGIWILSVLVVRTGLPFRDAQANGTFYALARYEPRIKMLRQLNRDYDLAHRGPMLFLSDGVANYVIRNKSHLRYFYPFPLQRIRFQPALADTELHRTQLSAALTFDGEYVLLEPEWIDLALLPALARKLETEYEPVFEASQKTAGTETILLRRKGRPAASERGVAPPPASFSRPAT